LRELKQLKKRSGLGKSCSISDPQQILPLAKVAFEAHALGDLEACDDTRSICLPDFPAVSHVRRFPSETDKGGKQAFHRFAFPTGKKCGQKSLPTPREPSYVIDANLPKLT
jgi:hypothetical protein